MNIQKNFDLTPYLTLKTQVLAENYVNITSREELIELFQQRQNFPKPYFFLGGGSNYAILKNRISGLVIKNNYISKKILSETDKEVFLEVSSGYPMSLLVKETIASGYEGLEYQFGLPGTLGGAIYMNSKWTRPLNYISDCFIEAELITQEGIIKKVDKNYFQFGYDFSILQKTNEIVLKAVFRLKKSDPKILEQRALATVAYRQQTQPTGVASSGCFFRNIEEKEKVRLNLPTASAGYLIDQCGLKGKTIGNFYISDKHANFILNKGQGKPEDLLQLLQLIKNQVKEKFGLELKEEVVVVK